MRRKKIFIIAFICIAVIALAVCAALMLKSEDTLYSDFDHDEQYKLEKNGAKEYSSPVLVMYGEEEQLIGVTQLGNKVYLDNPDSIIIEQGSVASKVQITVGDDGIRRGTLCYPYKTDINPPVYCPQKQAPQMMAEQCLKRQLNSTDMTAIYDYRINSVEVTQSDGQDEGTAVIGFKVNCDVIPSDISRAYGMPDGDGWVEGIELQYNIWGTNQTWYMLGDDPVYRLAANYITEEKREPEETLLYENDAGVSVRSVSFYTPDETILYDTPIGKEEMMAGVDLDEEDETIESYYTELFCVDEKTKKKTVLEHGNYNFQYTYLYSKYDCAYLIGNTWENESEISGNHLICVDLSDFTVKRITEFSTVLGITRDAIYAVGVDPLGGEDRKQQIFAIEIENGTLKWVKDLPYETTEDNFIVAMGVYDGYVHVMYSGDKICFKADEATGIWEID